MSDFSRMFFHTVIATWRHIPEAGYLLESNGNFREVFPSWLAKLSSIFIIALFRGERLFLYHSATSPPESATDSLRM